MRYLILFLLLSMSCSPGSLNEYRQEAKSVTKALQQQLESIESPEQLVAAEASISKKFNQLVDLMIQAQECQRRSLGLEPLQDDFRISDDLKAELRRIYQMERGREYIERASREAMIRLDAYVNARPVNALSK